MEAHGHYLEKHLRPNQDPTIDMPITHVKLPIAVSFESSKLCDKSNCPHIQHHERDLYEWSTCNLFARIGQELLDHPSDVPNILDSDGVDGGPVLRLPECLRAEMSE